MTEPLYIETAAAQATGVRADLARRTITGLVVPWDSYANVSSGQRVAFAPGAVAMGDRVKLNVDHDAGRPVGVITNAEQTDAGLMATFRIPAGDAGDQMLLEAAEGLRDGLSIGADVDTASETDDGLYVTSARARHVALVSEPAYDDARVSSVVAAAPGGPAVTMTEPAPDPAPVAPVAPAPPPAEPPATLTTAGVIAGNGAPMVGGAHVQDPYPYWVGGPHSMLRDAWLSVEGDAAAAGRLATAQRYNADTRSPNAQAASLAMVRASMAPAFVRAAPGDTTNQPGIVPPGYRPDLWTPLIAYESPMYNAAAKSPISDFTPFVIPTETARTGLSGVPADQVTPVAPGTISTAPVTVTPVQVYGAYQFSRALAMSSNPAIDMIANNAMDQEWLKDIETRLIAFAALAGNSTAATATYADGPGFVVSARGQMAAQRISRHAPTRSIVTPAKEYVAAVTADDLQKRPLLGWDGSPNMYGPGSQGNAAMDATILGVPTLPEGAAPLPAAVTFYIVAGDLVVFATPVMNFRMEYNGTNPLVITVVKYSGVAFWTRYLSGVRKATNTTPITDVAGIDPAEFDRPPAELGDVGAGALAPATEPDTAKAKR